MFQSTWTALAGPYVPALPVFNSNVFQQNLSRTVDSTNTVVQAAAKAGKAGGYFLR